MTVGRDDGAEILNIKHAGIEEVASNIVLGSGFVRWFMDVVFPGRYAVILCSPWVKSHVNMEIRDA